jgi:hypothetical protein
MGAALAKTLVKTTSHKVTIWNRTADRPQVTALVEAGASFEPDLAAALASHIIIICVLDYDAVRAVLQPCASALSAKTIVNLTNGTPAQAREMRHWIKARGAAHYFDGAVMVPPQLVGTEASFILYSGETEAAFTDKVAHVVEALGASQYTGEDVNSAATDDLAALATMYGMFAGFFTGLGLIGKQGRVAPSVNRVVVPVMKAMVPYLSMIADAVDAEDWDNNLGNPLGMQVAGVDNILQACREESVNAASLEAFVRAMRKTVEARGGDVGVPAVAIYHDAQVASVPV